MKNKTNTVEQQKNSAARQIMGFLMVTFLCIVAAELASRFFWSRYGVPISDPGRILYAYYPEMIKVDQDRPSRGNGFYNVLLLGGSVLHKNWGTVEKELGAQLASSGYKNVRIYNLAMPGHTSRDSWLKYSTLGQSRFDLVVYYHGINDSRANNAPPEIFRKDYSHYIWYEMVNTMARHHGSALFALPYTLQYLAVSTRQTLTKDRYIPFSNIREEWVQYGGAIRSAESFRQNLSDILNVASSRGDRVMTMTFATYVPNDYSPESYEWPLEICGRREFVLSAIHSHNEIVKKLAAKNKRGWITDQAALMPGDASFFEDPYHLTAAGSRQFVKNMLKVLLQ